MISDDDKQSILELSLSAFLQYCYEVSLLAYAEQLQILEKLYANLALEVATFLKVAPLVCFSAGFTSKQDLVNIKCVKLH